MSSGNHASDVGHLGRAVGRPVPWPGVADQGSRGGAGAAGTGPCRASKAVVVAGNRAAHQLLQARDVEDGDTGPLRGPHHVQLQEGRRRRSDKGNGSVPRPLPTGRLVLKVGSAIPGEGNTSSCWLKSQSYMRPSQPTLMRFRHMIPSAAEGLKFWTSRLR